MRKVRPNCLTRGKVNDSHTPYATQLNDWAGSYYIKAPNKVDYLCLMIGPGEPQIVWLQAGYDFPAWDHVSVSVQPTLTTDGKAYNPRRLPSWEEMHFVKRLCWEDDETVIQIHAPASVYVNQNPWVLHLWKPIGIEIPLPPTRTIGTKVTGYEPM